MSQKNLSLIALDILSANIQQFIYYSQTFVEVKYYSLFKLLKQNNDIIFYRLSSGKRSESFICHIKAGFEQELFYPTVKQNEVEIVFALI